VLADRYAARKPPLAICVTVMGQLKKRQHKKQLI
jgi:hypothetical protein